jgi:hypothetical protein
VSCTDDANWSYRHGNQNRGCSFTQGKAGRCSKVGNDGRAGYQACECTCPSEFVALGGS